MDGARRGTTLGGGQTVVRAGMIGCRLNTVAEYCCFFPVAGGRPAFTGALVTQSTTNNSCWAVVVAIHGAFLAVHWESKLNKAGFSCARIHVRFHALFRLVQKIYFSMVEGFHCFPYLLLFACPRACPSTCLPLRPASRPAVRQPRTPRLATRPPILLHLPAHPPSSSGNAVLQQRKSGNRIQFHK